MWLKSLFFPTPHNHSTNVDTEKQSTPIHCEVKFDEEDAASIKEVPRDKVFTVLQTLESKFGRILEDHMQEIKMLRESTTGGKRSSVIGEMQSPKQLRSSSTTAAKPENNVTNWNDQETSRIDIHVNHLDDFLTEYMKNMRLLQEQIKNPDSPDPMPAASQNLESLRKQFEMQLVISTFSAALIVGFASLIQKLLVDSARNRRLFDVGLLISFFTISCHIFIIAISGRSASLTSDSRFTSHHGIEVLRSALSTCDNLYMLAIYSFSATLLMMSFVVFENVSYPVAYCGTVAFGIVVLLSSKLRHLSVLYWRVFRLKKLVAQISNSCLKR